MAGQEASSIDIEFVVPVYREDAEILARTLADIRAALQSLSHVRYAITVVNDGSPPEYRYEEVARRESATLIEQPGNRGYGAALKRAIRQSRATWIAITDSDSTYPNREFHRLIEKLPLADMVVGARTTQVRNIPWPRRFPKAVLNRFASYMAGKTIPDLNSGMRIFRRDAALDHWALYPDRFSFTSTITMAFLADGLEVLYEPVDYYKRSGASSIRPIRDTQAFFKLVGWLGLFFSPMRLFSPLAIGLLVLGAGKGARDYMVTGAIGNLALYLSVAALQVYLMGLLGELIVRKR